MKLPSPFLWQLIHSLTNGEKLFFKRNYNTSKTTDQHIYIRLFDAISKQKEYNEKEILKKFNPHINKKNIAYQKHYLQQEICNALVQYESRDNSNFEIFSQIQLISIYRKKGLYNEAHSIWKKAVEKARRTESFALLNLLKAEFEKLVLFSSIHFSYDELHTVFKKNIISYNEYADMITLRDIYTEALLLKRKAHFDIDDSLLGKIKSLLDSVCEIQTKKQGNSFWFRHYYNMSKATLLYLQNEYETSFELLQLTFQDWNENVSFIRTHGEFYIEVLHMINYAGILNGSYSFVLDAFANNINELITEPIQKANFEVIKYLALNKIYNKLARYDEVKKLVAYMKSKYNQWETVINADLNKTTNLSLSISCFVLEEFEDALYFSKRATSYFNDGSREEYASVAQILLLLITYNLNNERLFESQFKTTYSYFHKKSRKQPFETALIQCLHRTFYMTENKKRVIEYEKALQVFEENKTNIIQERTVGIFNYPVWLISKIKRKSYREYVRQLATEEKSTQE